MDAVAPPRRTPLTVEQQSLASRYMSLARSIAKPLRIAWPNEKAEFESAAMLALVEAAQSFDPTRNVKFGTFARYRIWGAMRDVQRRLILPGWQKDRDNAPTLGGLPIYPEEHGRLLGRTRVEPPVGEQLEDEEWTDVVIDLLPARHKAAFRAVVIDELTQAEAAKALGCSKSRVSVLVSESKDILNDVIAYRERREEKVLNKSQKFKNYSYVLEEAGCSS